MIELAKTLPAPEEIESGSIVGGFAHNQVLELADKVVEAVKSGAIKKFFVMAGCGGRMKSREYYHTEFCEETAEGYGHPDGLRQVPVQQAGPWRHRGIPRVLDAGQCNDSYSLAVIALKLKEAFGVDSVNELPIAFNIAWYEQKR